MYALFVANLELEKTEGIYKKVWAEAEAISHAVGECELITRKGANAVVRECGSENEIQTEVPFLNYVCECINTRKIGVIYIRHMIPSFLLIKVLNTARKANTKIYYEIPTYPYFAEQLRTSRKKYRAIAKIGLDVLFWPFIYKKIDKLVIIKSNTKAKIFPKMVEITNGVRIDDIKSKSYARKENHDVFRMVAVGTLYPYHGYDRVLKGLETCGETINGTTIEFHVVGSSETIEELKQLSIKMGLKHVIFHGTKTTDELNEMYDSFDVGLGCIALHRRNADIDTTLKVIEYYCRGIPVITSGLSPFGVNDFTYIVPDNEEAIDIKSIYDFYNSINENELKNMSGLAKDCFSWDNIMLRLLSDN